MWLLGLSAFATLLSLARSDFPGGWAIDAANLAILAIGWAKARVILWHYLGLAGTGLWRQGFDFAVTAYTLLLMALTVLG
ncbi:nitric oxide reductase F protein [Albidovulum aquaemixtae]|nr:nitric oxide reductase F protein [Defluviimonas aquaemixtae]